MARQVLRFTVPDAGRDQGKVFVITEMPASQAERWAARAFLALSQGGTDIPDAMMDSGMAGIAKMGISLLSKMRFEDAEVLMEEMFGCVQYQPNPNKPEIVRDLIEDDIEEVKTRISLRMEIFKLHVDFSQVADPSEPTAAAQNPQG